MSEVGTAPSTGDENCTDSNEGKFTATKGEQGTRKRKEYMENYVLYRIKITIRIDV